MYLETEEIHNKRIKVAELALIKEKTLTSIAKIFNCSHGSISQVLHTFCRNSNKEIYDRLLIQCRHTTKPELATLVKYKHEFYHSDSLIFVDKIKLREERMLEASALVLLDGLSMADAAKKLAVSVTNIRKLINEHCFHYIPKRFAYPARVVRRTPLKLLRENKECFFDMQFIEDRQLNEKDLQAAIRLLTKGGYKVSKPPNA